ncbi:uncharacterized protein PITG_20008 [Phytophthora infestans T30-4]|uniref:Uncharacterized protein n=1 Tax=Phytophthora infestans (strain T30-4) TaxID=403677 RepID=D0P172_PHYIT|nr:uncharacterized protein PITG_20008 [Phytophthora infestans T30-4]EEY54095.1 hypothetical protein PITG_20008 [Phytophthora infestans T30-4]|eukprot:XP_002895947.1 hypothetical protein PITG_20008 [Phytophthora infestans T30-4]
MIMFDFGVDISTSTIFDKLIGKLYTMNQRTQKRAKKDHDDIVLLRLAPYFPMCPIEDCLSVLKARIKSDLSLSREVLAAPNPAARLPRRA